MRWMMGFVVLVLVAFANSACSAEGQDASATEVASGALYCGEVEYEIDGKVQVDQIIYSVSEINRALANSAAASELLGADAVDDCRDAELATRILRDLSLNGDEGTLDTEIYPSELVDKIRYAAGSGPETGTVEFILDGYSCSGALIAKGALVTSAHCLDTRLSPASPNDGSTVAPVMVNYHDPSDGNWYCISNQIQTPGKCTNTSNAVIVMHGPYTGDGNTDSDIGVVLMPDYNWSRITTADLLRVYTGSFGAFPNYEIHGRGHSSYLGGGLGVVRWGSFGNDVYGTYAFYSIARTPRICAGDSGGPSIVVNSGHENVIGLTSKVEMDSYGVCAKSGGKQYSTRMNQKIAWVESVMTYFKGASHECHSFTGTLGNYRRCW